jgi:addiction module HigA family antidote
MPCQHPGKVLLQQYLQPQNISQNALARAIKVPPRRINEIIHEKRGITADTAVRLAIYFGGSAIYWMHLQAEFEIEKVKHNISTQLSTIQPPEPPPELPPAPVTKTSARTTEPKQPNIKKRLMR